VPEKYDVTVVGDKERDAFTSAEQCDWYANLSIEAIKTYRKHIHLNAFSYGVKFLPDDERSAVFSFIVYRAVMFLVLISPRSTSPLVVPSSPPIVLRV
jgi:hypothetical protein